MNAVGRNPRTACRRYDTQTLVITPDDSKVHTLNETATMLWEALGQGTCTAATLFDRALQEFDGEPEQVKNDIAVFIATGLDRGFLVREGAVS